MNNWTVIVGVGTDVIDTYQSGRGVTVTDINIRFTATDIVVTITGTRPPGNSRGFPIPNHPEKLRTIMVSLPAPVRADVATGTYDAAQQWLEAGGHLHVSNHGVVYHEGKRRLTGNIG